MPVAFATLTDLQERHPQEVILLGADEATGLLDEVRVTRALDDASIEARTILAARYSATELSRVDEDGLATLRIYVMDIALYRVALSFSRLTDEIRERYQAAVKRLEAIAAGKGALSLSGEQPAGGEAGAETSTGGAAIVTPEPFFPRRNGGLW